MNKQPFEIGQKIKCIETDKDSMINSTYNEKIHKRRLYIVDDCFFDKHFNVWCVKVNDMRTEWDATSFELTTPKTK